VAWEEDAGEGALEYVMFAIPRCAYESNQNTSYPSALESLGD